MLRPLQSHERRPSLTAPRRVQPVRAARAFGRLVADKEDTRQVFEIMNALAGRSIDWGYQRLLQTPEGGAQAYGQVELSDRLQDRAWLDGFVAGTVGAAYRDFIDARSLSAYGLADESRKVADSEIEAAHPRAWYARRIRDVHDIWHVLTGYQTDALGEACVVAFSLPQTRSAGFGLIAAGAAVQFMRARTGHPCGRAVLQAWRSGRRAAWLPGQDYEALMAQPLEAARLRLKIARPTVYDAVPPAVRNAYQGAPG
ncbi:ubiquinone biosynthesis protein [Caulobacter hibisci]|uniref:Ubiquinone biosynthesis protein n=1 Tax=Caulobacter hibisci TaxID=2035993 RepID=A0ABS0SXM1_9CAUL|nr:ubiquinone biosynthesis protein [Caulobacter hibisci]